MQQYNEHYLRNTHNKDASLFVHLNLLKKKKCKIKIKISKYDCLYMQEIVGIYVTL